MADNPNEEATKLYVANLPAGTTPAALLELFSQHGYVASANVLQRKNGHLVGIIEYQEADIAEGAIQAQNGQQWHGRALYVTKKVKSAAIRSANLNSTFDENKKGEDEKLDECTLLVDNIPQDFNEDALKAQFLPFGSILRSKIMKNSTGGSKGYGFLTFSHSSDKKKAKAVTMARNKLGFTRFRVDEPDPRNHKGKTILIHKISKEIDEKHLARVFSVYGKVDLCKILLGKRNISLGCGYIKFSTEEEAQRAIIAMRRYRNFQDDVIVTSPSDITSLKYENEIFKDRRVLIRNIPRTLEEPALFHYFSEFGYIESCKILMSKENQSLGCGSVTYSTETAAAKAVKIVTERRQKNATPFIVASTRKKRLDLSGEELLAAVVKANSADRIKIVRPLLLQKISATMQNNAEIVTEFMLETIDFDEILLCLESVEDLGACIRRCNEELAYQGI